MPRDDGNQPRHDEAYFDDQWEKAREREKESGDTFRRYWYKWRREQAGRAPYSAWLVVPCNLSDYGARPLPSGTPHWASPFIGVNSPDPSGKPLAGAPNRMFARVFNLGAATAAPTRVEFSWADPSVGLGAVDAHLIGVETVEIPPMSSVVVTCSTPWIPSYVNGGHECAFVNTHNHVLDPLLQPFKPWADRHVGQRNLSVLPAVTQAMMLWLPATSFGRIGQLRALALKAKALQGLPPFSTPVARLEAVAQWALQGLRQLPAGAKADPERKPLVAAKRIGTQQLLQGIRVLDATRIDCATAQRNADEEARVPLKELDTLGDIMLNQDVHDAEHARQIELQLQPIDLAMDEVAILNLTYVRAGVVEGGYVVVLAHPAWFKSAVLAPEASPGAGVAANPGGLMTMPHSYGPTGGRPSNDQQLRDLVVQFNPQARATLELAQQLAPLLPIESADQLSKELRVGGEGVDAAFLMQFAAGMLPISDEKDLVFKLASVLKLACAHGEAHRPTLSAATARFLDQLNSIDAGAKAPPPVLYGRDSLFRLDAAARKGA